MNKLFGLLLLLGLSTPCYGTSVTFVGAAGMSSATFPATTDFTTGTHSYQIGGGLLINYRMIAGLSTELGILYLPRGFSQTTSTYTYETTFNTVQVPLVLRINLLPSLSLGLGGYFSHGFGSVYGNLTTDPATLYTSEYRYSYGADDFGAVLSLALKFNVAPFTSIVIDARYLSGLENISKMPGVTTRLNDFQGLVGVRFGK